MLPDRNDPLFNRLAFHSVNKFWIEKCGIFILQNHLVGFIVGRNTVYSVKILWLTKEICSLIHEVLTDRSRI